MTYVRFDNLTIQRGDDRPFSWPLLDTEGNPLDLGGYTATAVVTEFQGTDVLYEWSTANQTIVLATGSVSLLTVGSTDWDWPYGTYTLRITDPENRSEVIARGTVVLES